MACAHVVVSRRVLDVRSRDRAVVAVEPGRHEDRRGALDAVVLEREPAARRRSYHEGVSSYVSPRHLIVAVWVPPGEDPDVVAPPRAERPPTRPAVLRTNPNDRRPGETSPRTRPRTRRPRTDPAPTPAAQDELFPTG